ncbi:MAG: CAP domain-containing protein [Anaerolineae bacterium]|nr:CAP domain-containing protein [Anaerolineae bacterium]
MKQRVASAVASIVLLIVVTLLIPGPLAGQGPPTLPAGGEPFPPVVPAPVGVEAGIDAPTYPGCGGVFAPVVNAQYEQEVVDLVNSIRASNSLPPLKRVDLLDEAARYHATDMGEENYFEHDSQDRSGGSLVLACSWSARITTYYPGWSSLAENIAVGSDTPTEVMNSWMDSSGHRANILSAGNWEIGVGYYAGSGDHYSYWVQDFGKRWDIYPLIIDADAAATSSHYVTLYIYGDWQEMRLRNDDGDWTGWLPFQSTSSWTLPVVGGDHTVWAELRDGGLTATSSDTIHLDAASPALGGLPTSLAFSYNVPTGALEPAAYDLTPQNVGSGQALTWQLSQVGDWFVATPATGTTPDSFRIEPTTFDPSTPGTYTGRVTVTVVDPPGTAGSPHTIELLLEVVDVPAYYIFVPIVVR